MRLTKSNMPLESTRSAIRSWLFRQPSCHVSEVSIAYISSADLM